MTSTVTEARLGLPQRRAARELDGSLSAQLVLQLVDDVQNQPIIRQLHTGGQAGAGGGVRQIVADVREVGALGAQPRHAVERFRHAEMRRVRPIAQRIEDQRPHPVEQRPRLVRNAAAIGQVRELADAEAENRPMAVQERHRHDLERAEDERAADPEQR